jgi:adenosylcobinamide-phosphate synthase
MSQALSVAPLIFGYLLDLALGDPGWMPHPIVAYGRLVHSGERRLNRGSPCARFVLGALFALALVAATCLLWAGALAFAARLHPFAAAALETFGVFAALANRTLVDEGRAVFRALDADGLPAARRRLSRIVGRDTARLDAQQVRTATLETLSENLGDGVVAPLFWYAAGGVPAMMAYKMISTLDSMIGHRDARHEYFGKTAARLDDLANFIPARLTAFLIAALAGSPRSFRYIVRYGRAHASPNAGYPEAALAGVLGARFGGPHTYGGDLVDKPFIGESERPLTAADFTRGARLNHAVCAVCVLLAGLARLFLRPMDSSCLASFF